MSGVIKVTADTSGLIAKADVIAHIPGVDEAKGTFIYSRSAGWSGSFTITSSKIPYVERANVTVTLTDKGLDLDGGLEIALPGDSEFHSASRGAAPTSWVYIGKGEFKVPRLKPVSIDFEYDGEDLTGTAKTGFTLRGWKGTSCSSTRTVSLRARRTWRLTRATAADGLSRRHAQQEPEVLR